MAELDYAFVADYARIEGGKLTAVGASFTYLRAPSLPTSHVMSIAGRIRAKVEDPPVALRAKVQAPAEQYTLAFDADLAPVGTIRPYGDRNVGILFALTIAIPLPAEGLYEVFIDLDGSRARRLAFDVELAPPDRA